MKEGAGRVGWVTPFTKGTFYLPEVTFQPSPCPHMFYNFLSLLGTTTWR